MGDGAGNRLSYLNLKGRHRTYPDLLILGTSGKILSVRTEAHATDVEIAVLVDVLVLQSGDVLTSGHVKNLSGAVATGGQVFSIPTETNAANNAVMDEMVDELDVQHSLHLGVEDGVPVGSLSLLRSRQVIGVPVGQHVSRTLAHDGLTRRGRARQLRGHARVRIGQLVGLLGGRWAGRSASFARTGGGGWGGRGSIAYVTNERGGVRAS